MSRHDLWSPERIDELRTLWLQGLSCAAIAREMGMTKNSVVGKAHRLDLDARPSPIIRRVDRRGVDGNTLVTDGHLPEILRMMRLGHNTIYIAARMRVSLPSLRQVIAAHRHEIQQATPQLNITAFRSAHRVVCTAPPKPPEAPKPAPAPRGKSERRCEWLDGDKPYTRCTEAHLPGRPYCAGHNAIAHPRRAAPEAPVQRATW